MFSSRLHASLRELLAHSLPSAPPALARSLRQLRASLRAGALSVGLREIDRAWRRWPMQAATLAPIYAHLLALEARDHDATLELLQRTGASGWTPELAALRVLALLQLQRLGEARQHVAAALAGYCIEAGSLLEEAMAQAARHPAMETPGWVGRGGRLELVGEITAPEGAQALEIEPEGRPAFLQILGAAARPGSRLFRFRLPRLEGSVRLGVRGRALLGSPMYSLPEFSLDGRARSERGRIVTGWARVGWRPRQRVALQVQDETGRRCTLASSRTPLADWRWPFRLDLRASALRGERIEVSAQLPGGRWQPLPDAPLLLPAALRLEVGRARTPRRAPRATAARSPAAAVDVVIPVYRNREASLATIDAVLATAGAQAHVHVLVVDDATEDRALAAALDALATLRRIELLRNEVNRGFVASVNRALALHPAHDAVLLNADTRVYGDWLVRLRRAAYAAPRIGTVTPFSNCGSIASYPGLGDTPMSPEAAAGLQAHAAAAQADVSAALPVGVGFCLYLRRDCLADTGPLDEAVFGKGYGEETDFCLRASRRGWSHRLAADVYVYHAGALSFGARRAALLDRSQRLLNLRHPGYDRVIADFLARDPLGGVRRRLDEQRLAAFEGRFVLLVTLALEGGVQRFVVERARALRTQGLFPLILRPAAAGDATHCRLDTEALAVPNLRYAVPAELPVLMALLRGLRLEAVEIQHFLHLDRRVIEAVRALPVPYDVYVHDYAWVCPRITLIDDSGRYCGEPAVAVCRHCVRRNGSQLAEPISVSALRARSDGWLRGARRVLAPSLDTAARLQRYFPRLAVQVQPYAHVATVAEPPGRDGARRALRVALLGAIGQHKGYDVLRRCARDARARRLPLEFVVIGYTESDAPLLRTGKVFITGRYGEAEALHLLRREQPDLAWLPSVWPETWCYALDHVLAAGLPVAGFDLGAIGERLRMLPGSLLLPLGLPPSRINDRLLAFRQGTSSGSRFSRPALLKAGRDANMTVTPFDGEVMAKVSDDKPSQEGQGSPQQESSKAGLSASVQLLPLPPGLYLFSVTEAAPAASGPAGQLALPAVHVGVGPGVRSEQVEFISGPSTHGAWLFSPRDLLVTRVSGAGATMVLTSVRTPGGEVLSIKVERLDQRTEAAPPAARAAAPVTAIAAARAPVPAAPAGALRSLAAPGPAAPVDGPLPLPIHILAHIRSRGDMSFSELPWAGQVAPGLWIEAFSIRPLAQLRPEDVEYKALTGSGFETPWISNDQICGTRGMAVPLVGFAVRLKPGPATAAYDCEYSGYFQSSVTVGPMRNGAPCRSSMANDPLEGMQIRIVRRSSVAPAAAARIGGPVAPLVARQANAAARPDGAPAVVAPTELKGARAAAADASRAAIAAAPRRSDQAAQQRSGPAPKARARRR